MIRTLKRLLPRTLLTAMFTAPMRRAARVTTSSGREVANATSVVPTKVSSTPRAAAISPATKGSQRPTATTAMAAIQ